MKGMGDSVAKSNEINMTEGSIMKNVIRFSIPLMLSGLLQLLYNAADIIVVGKFVGKEALGAVGATSSFTNLIVNFFISLSVGTSVLVARNFGAKNYEKTQSALHSSIALSLVGGVIVMFIGVLFSEKALEIMKTPNDIIGGATLYMRIYFLAAPALVFYNFGAMALRAVGDTKRPLEILTVSGIVNVILNLFLVIGFNLGVAGVAIATAVSTYVSAVMILVCFVKMNGFCHLDIKKIKFHKDDIIQILKIGIPASIQSITFSISNVIIQSSVNSFNSAAIVAGNSAASNVEGFAYTAMNSVHHAAVTVVGQNMGAKKYNRITKSLLCCLGFVFAVGVIFVGIILAMPKTLMHLYSSDPEVVSWGILRLDIIVPTYFFCGIMEVIVGATRGMGGSFLPMCASIIGVCGTRIVWIFTVFAKLHTLEVLYISYPISWAGTALAQLVCFALYKRKVFKQEGVKKA